MTDSEEASLNGMEHSNSTSPETHNLEQTDTQISNSYILQLRDILDTLYLIDDEEEDTSIKISTTYTPEKDSADSNEWIELAPMPQQYFSNPVIINQSEIVIAPHTNGCSEDQEPDFISKYNVNSNTWSKFIKYPPNFHSKHQSMCLNDKTNELYLYGSKPTMLKINIATKETKIISDGLVRAGMYSPTCFINNQFHLIGGHKNSRHFVFNEDEHKFAEIFHFKEWIVGNIDPGLVNITFQKKLLLFGGYDFGEQATLDSIWMFDYSTNESMQKGWNKMNNIKLPKGTLNSGYTMSNDQQYVFIFGGSDGDENYLDDIYILNISDINNMYIEKSGVTCPVKDLFHAMVMPKNPMDGALVCGYIRYCMNDLKIDIPDDMVRILVKWVSCDYVHLLKDEGHWKIPVDYLLSDMCVFCG
eukprot:469591_1